MRRRFVLLTSLVAVLATFVLSAPGAVARPLQAEQVGPMAIAAFTYVPSVVVARPNEVIRVVNVDGTLIGIPHSVTGAGFNTGIFTGTSAFRAPGRRGVFVIHCQVHPFMRGVLRVRR
jgi:hypothetical protein